MSSYQEDEETKEALQVFESDPNINLGLSSTRVMGRILARALRAAWKDLADVTKELRDTQSKAVSLAQEKQDEIFELRARLEARK